MHPSTLERSVLEDLHERSAADAVEALEALGAALTATSDPEALVAVVQALPVTVAELTPEVALAVHEVAMMLIPHRPRLPLDLERLEPWLRSRWLRLGLATGDPSVLRGLDESMLRATLEGWSLDAVLDPEPLVRRLVGARDPWLRRRGLHELGELVEGLALTAARALDVVEPLVADDDVQIRALAITSLGRAWLRGLPPGPSRRRDEWVRRALRDAEPPVAAAALGVAVALGRREWLLECLDEPEHPVASQARILAALGPMAREEDLDPLLARASARPLPLAGPCRSLLLEAHRHGVFPRDRHLPALLSSFDAHPGWSGEELVRVTHIVRHELVECLAGLAPDDPRWIRRAEILAASVSPRAPAVLAMALESTSDPGVAAALVEAAGQSAAYEREEPLLRWLDALPEVVIPVLHVKGAEPSRLRLRALVEDPAVSTTLRRLAMGSLWALTHEREALLRELSARLGPHESGVLDPSYRVLRDRRIASIVVEAPWPEDPAHEIEPRRRFEVMCESGDRALWPRIESLFRELYRGYVRRALAGDFTIKRVVLPELEQQVFRYGRHLVAEGWSVRRFVGPGPQTGRDLLVRWVCSWLAEEPAPAVMVALLETLGRHGPSGSVLRSIEPLWRHGNREVRRAAIEALLEAGEGVRGLELSICRLAEHEEPRILVQALAGVRVLEATWAEPMVLRALAHPHMGVKKEAAEALAQMATAAAVPIVVEWLAHHDNAAFRRSLGKALRRAAGRSAVAVLVEALERETERRRIDLLHEALSGVLPLRVALRLARSERPAHRRLLDACLDGTVTLHDGSRDALAARLHRARLHPEEPSRDPGRRLRVEGFDPQAALALLEDRRPEDEALVLSTVRLALAEWIGWLSADDVEPDPDALALVFDAALARHEEHVERLLSLAERPRAAVDAGAVGLFIDRCVALPERPRPLKVPALRWLRAAPPDPRRDGLRRRPLLSRVEAGGGR
ncbi:MAG: HEAT repeat domain-containing protein, partial [Nannocystaceae bacterium]